METSKITDMFYYENGFLKYKKDGLRVKKDDVAGWETDNGYLRVSIDWKNHYLHRLIWQIHFGETKSIIDHIDGDKKNNKIENLRCSNYSKNGLNRKKSRSDSSTGLIGVLCGTTKKGTKTYQSRITINKKTFFLGNFKTAIEAHNAYMDFKNKLVKF